MRARVDRPVLQRFMERLSAATVEPVRVYVAGGASAVLIGWRGSTVDVDLKMVPESDKLMREIPRLKEALQVNVEFASPADFIPLDEGWEGRSPFIEQQGKASFYHFDFYAQALSKLERYHERDELDVKEMLRRGLVEPSRLREVYERIEPFLYRFPAIDPPSLRERLESTLRKHEQKTPR